MKIARIGKVNAEQPVVIGEDGRARDIRSMVADITPDTLAYAIESLRNTDMSSLPVIDGPFRYGPPINQIGKIICIGLNYRKHAEEAGMELPEEPAFFLKATSSRERLATCSLA